MKYALGVMDKNGSGSIVNISSISGIVGQTYTHMGYNASKGAVRIMTKSAAIQYAENGFIVGKRLSSLLKRAPHLTHNTKTKTYFNMDEGGLNQGEKIQNLELAKTFKLSLIHI